MNFKKIISHILFSSLLGQVHAGFALNYNLSLLTKKYKNGITHCIWNFHHLNDNIFSSKENITKKAKSHPINTYLPLLRMAGNNVSCASMKNTCSHIKEKYIDTIKKKEYITLSANFLHDFLSVIDKTGLLYNKIKHTLKNLSGQALPRTCGRTREAINLIVMSFVLPTIARHSKNFIINTLQKYKSGVIKAFVGTIKTCSEHIVAVSIALLITHILIHKLLQSQKKHTNKNLEQPDPLEVLQESYLNDIHAIKSVFQQLNPEHNAHFVHSFMITEDYNTRLLENTLLQNKYRHTYETTVFSDIDIFSIQNRMQRGIEILNKNLELLKKEKEKKERFTRSLAGTKMTKSEIAKVVFLGQIIKTKINICDHKLLTT